MKTIFVREDVGPSCLTAEEGQKLHDVIRSCFESDEVVALDFSDVRVFASLFFNAAVGQLLQDYSVEYLREHLKFYHINQLGQETLQQVVDNARKYYSSTELQETLEKRLDQDLEDE